MKRVLVPVIGGASALIVATAAIAATDAVTNAPAPIPETTVQVESAGENGGAPMHTVQVESADYARRASRTPEAATRLPLIAMLAAGLAASGLAFKLYRRRS